MKIALCLHGYYGTVSTSTDSSVFGGHTHLKNTIFSKTSNVDTFVHCWQPDKEQEIGWMYKPKKLLTEEQINFDTIASQNGIEQAYIDGDFPRERTIYNNATASRILSFYYSRVQSLKLAFEGSYDWIITTRFDIGQRGGNEVNQIRFFPERETNFLYTTMWDQLNVGYGDMWFYGSPEIMKEYANIYERALEDFKPGSEYEGTLLSGWPDSNTFDGHDSKDPRQFTNEVLKPSASRSKDLMKFPRWRVTDSHLHHKWFCMKNGLYEKTRWV